MAIAHAHMTLANAVNAELPSMQLAASVDDTLLFTRIPEPVRAALDLPKVGTRQETLANGQTVNVPYVGPLDVRLENRHGFVGAVVVGADVMIGSLALNEMDLSIDSDTHRLIANSPSSRGVRPTK